MKKFTLALLSILLFTAATPSFSQSAWSGRAPFAGGPRTSAVGFAINGYGYIATGFDSSSFRRVMYQYDPTTDIWTQKTSLGGVTGTGLGRDMAVSFVYQTFAYVATGQGGSPYLKDMWQYNSAGDYWTQKANFPGTPRRGAVSFMVNGKGYVATGKDSLGYKSDMWEYNIASNVWTQKANFIGSARSSAVGFAIGSKGYVGTGMDGTFKNDFYEYDPVSNLWTPKANYPGTPRYSACSMVIGTKGYVGCGYDNTLQNCGDFYEYDPSINFWTQKPSFYGTKRSNSVAFAIGSFGFLGTGYDGVVRDDFWIFDPLGTGISEQSKKFQSNVFPNPVDDEAHFTFDAASENEFTFRLMNVEGKLVQEEKFTGHDYIFKRNALENGVYFYSIFSGHSSACGKIILVH